MLENSCQNLIYFIGGLDNAKRRERSGIEVLCEAVQRMLPEGVGGRMQVRLHQYEQSINPLRRSSRKGPCIPITTSLKAEEHAEGINRAIQETVDEFRPKKLIVIAYSAGTVLFRRALADCASEPLGSDETSSGENWKSILIRVIHIGGMTTGWQFNSEMPKLYLALGPLVRPLCANWFPWQIYKGSRFITDTRIKLSRQRAKQRKEGVPAILETYLLGTEDEFIAPSDALEPGGQVSDGNPSYLEIDGCTHVTILSEKGQARSCVVDFIVHAILEKEQELSGSGSTLHAIHPDDIDDYLDPMDNQPARRDDSVKHVVIILHGIRDNGAWAQRIGNHIKNKWREMHQDAGRQIRIVSASYGYFSLWDFLRPGGRADAIGWYQNLYANTCALYPSAKISFLGHSNGTYLGTEALRCQNLTYESMVLAGSVVRRDFWSKNEDAEEVRQRVKRVFNFRSIDDWIVGLLPGGLEVIPVLGKPMNLGGAGAYGFHWPNGGCKSWSSTVADDGSLLSDPHDSLEGGKFVLTQRLIYGGHGAAIKPDTWDQLADYLLHADAPDTHGPGTQGHLKPIEWKEHPGWWIGNNVAKSTWFIRACGGAAIYAALLACAAPLLLSLLAMKGVLAHGLIAHFPLTMVISLVIALVAFWLLKRI
jgi:hypothetical protein